MQKNVHFSVSEKAPLRTKLTPALIMTSLLAPWLISCNVATAGVPTYDDYQNSLSGYKATTKSTTSINSFNSNNMEAVQQILSQVDSNIEKGDWDTVLKLLKSVNLQQLKANAANVSNKQAYKSLVEELSFTIGQLSDSALSNRVVFFNKVPHQLYDQQQQLSPLKPC